MTATLSLSRDPRQPSAKHRREDDTFWLWFTAIMIAGGLLRIWTISHNPGYELDEAVYTRVAENIVAGHGMRANGQMPGGLYGGSNYLSHPPFYFWALAAWMKVFGTGVTVARLFAVTTSMVAIAMCVLGMRRHYGERAALLGALALSTLSWFIFENRVAWIDNAQMILVAWMIVAFWRAQRTLETIDWVWVGVALGTVIVFKHTGAAHILGLLMALGLIRRSTPGWSRAALTVVVSCAAVVAAYLMLMTSIFGDTYLGQSFSQFHRSTGEVSSPGTLDLSWSGIQHAAGTPYWIFAGTAIVVIAAYILGLQRLWIVYRQSGSFGGHELLAGLTFGTIISLMILQLRFPHYFMMAFWPAAMYVAAEISERYRHQRLNRALITVVVLVTALNVIGGTVRLAWRPDSAIPQAAAYLERHSTRDDILLSDESFGNLTDIRYCMSNKPRCAAQATWIETYTSYTQKRPTNSPFTNALRNATVCVRWQGFREVVSIYAVAPRTCPDLDPHDGSEGRL